MPTAPWHRLADPRCVPRTWSIVLNNVFTTPVLIAAGARPYHVFRRVLDRFGYMIAPMIALHYANTVVAVPDRSGACTANVARCRE